MPSFVEMGLARAANMREMVKTGEFLKVGKKHYRHAASGIEILYLHNSFRWSILGKSESYTVLHAAVSRVRYMTEACEW